MGTYMPKACHTYYSFLSHMKTSFKTLSKRYIVLLKIYYKTYLKVNRKINLLHEKIYKMIRTLPSL